MPKHLRYDYIDAIFKNNEKRHASEVLKSLGISYQASTPQTICDQYWFWNCVNIPNNLPSYITILEANPLDHLSELEAKLITK